MNVRTFLLATTTALALAAITGCDDGGTTTATAGTGGTGGSTGGTGGDTGGSGGAGGGPGAKMPKLGAQVDRMARPAINTAANQTFNTNPEQADQGKDGWNANADPSTWNQYIEEIQTNLAILDSLDTVCGNQLLADAAKMDPSRYATLATVLSDDRLYVNIDGATCTTYLAVEANAVGVMNNDCGGRRLSYDVIDVSYTILASGMLDASIGDTIPISDAAKGENFPHLNPPQ
jgi:hypothetical protein